MLFDGRTIVNAFQSFCAAKSLLVEGGIDAHTKLIIATDWKNVVTWWMMDIVFEKAHWLTHQLVCDVYEDTMAIIVEQSWDMLVLIGIFGKPRDNPF